MKDEKYLVWINQALLSFQIIEEALRLCIGLSYEVISASIPSEIDFKFSADTINNAALGNLIKMFSNTSKNDPLIEDLKKVVKWRNFCAHNAFAHEFMNRNSHSSFDPHSSEDVEKVAKFSSELVLRLGDELKKLQKIHAQLHS